MKTFRIKFQTIYTQLKTEITHDIDKNIVLLKNALEEKLQTEIKDDFIYTFKFFNNDYKLKTIKQTLQRFFECFKLYYEETQETELTQSKKDGKVVQSILDKLLLKKHITFKLRHYKIFIYIYNNEDKEKIGKINNPYLAINRIDFYVYDKNNKLKNKTIIEQLIKENLKDYIL